MRSLLLAIVVLGGVVQGMLASARAETLNWNYPASNTDITSGSSTTTVNGVSITSSNAFVSGKFTTNSAGIFPTSSSNGSSIGIVQMAMDATVDDSTAFQTLTVRFSEPVYNVSFKVLDIDGGPNYAGLWNDIVEFNSDNGRPTGVVANAAWVSYSAATGRASAISNQNAQNANSNQSFGDITLTFAGPITNFTIRHYAAAANDPTIAGDETDPAAQVIFVDDVTFTRSARLAIQKRSTGGVGTFNFSINNGMTFTAPSTYAYGAVSTSVTTTSPGVAVTGSQIILGTTNTSTTVTETGPSGWALSATTLNCADSNSGVSGNPATFTGTVSGLVMTLAPTNIRAGAVITCTLSNAAAAPAMTIVKLANTAGPVSVGASIGYTYTVTNTGNVAINNVSVSDSHNGFGTDPVPWSETLLTDNGTVGDSTDTTTNGVWNTLAPGDVIRFSSSYLVVQSDIDYRQ